MVTVLGPGPGEEPTSDRVGPLGGRWGGSRERIREATSVSAGLRAAQLPSTGHCHCGAGLPICSSGIWGSFSPTPEVSALSHLISELPLG